MDKISKEEFVFEFADYLPKEHKNHYNNLNEELERDYDLLFHLILDNMNSFGLFSDKELQEIYNVVR